MRELFRSVVVRRDSFDEKKPRPTRRPPGYVPYLVDNLWEWKRPEDFPNRRHSVFASPRADLALASGPPDGVACRVELGENAIVAQVEPEDSRYHPECRSLPRLLLRLLGQEWVDGELTAKGEAGRLFLPCLAKEEVEQIFQGGPLAKVRAELWGAIHYWEAARLVDSAADWPFDSGEVFFGVTSWRLIEP